VKNEEGKHRRAETRGSPCVSRVQKGSVLKRNEMKNSKYGIKKREHGGKKER